jgi:Ca2+-binding RTX toxin-like protein
MAIFDGTPGDDTLIGTALDDVINGFEGRDNLRGGLGNDKLDGGGNNDYLNGGADNDTLIGGAGNDILVGDTGNDSMVGGLGDDIYVVDSAGDKLTELAGQGNDVVLSSLVDYTLGANIEGLALGSTGVNGIGNTLNNTISGNNLGNRLDGGLGNDELYGDAGADTLLGGSGNDTLDGGSNADTMTGGAGNDVYVVNDAGDVVTELAGGGVDLVKTTLNGFMLGANVENLTLTGSADSGSGNDLANILIGNALENVLIGGKGNDTLDGGAGDDALQGGIGNDTYFVESRFDVVIEAAGEGKDTIQSSISYRLLNGQEIETLILSSSAAIVTGDGNNFANTITMMGAGKATLSGHDGNDTLNGGAQDDTLFGDNDNDVLNGGGGRDIQFGGFGDDTLNGGEGNDSLFGGAGDDKVTGGIGDDVYYVTDASDLVTELGGQGEDMVKSYIADYTMTPNVEYMRLAGDALNGTGNTLDNQIWGNAQSNILNGGLGFDGLEGLDGDDTLNGGSGGDELEGGLGADELNGGGEQDIFVYSLEDTADLPALGNDKIHGFQSGVDDIDLARLRFVFGIDRDLAFSGGFVRLVAIGDDTLVQFDRDGTAGSAPPLTLATVVDASVAQSDVLVF